MWDDNQNHKRRWWKEPGGLDYQNCDTIAHARGLFLTERATTKSKQADHVSETREIPLHPEANLKAHLRVAFQ